MADREVYWTGDRSIRFGVGGNRVLSSLYLRMKEPEPNWCGLCKWRGVTVAKSTIDTMKLIGYLWNDRLDAYELVNPIKETPVPLAPISFEVDAFHRAVHKPYGGDCR